MGEDRAANNRITQLLPVRARYGINGWIVADIAMRTSCSRAVKGQTAVEQYA